LPAFVYRDSRDLTGFIDGSANPKDDDRYAAALIPQDRPGAGGSIVMTQKWIHDLDAFQRLPVRDQERVIGRTKEDSIELDEDEMPEDSHVSRTDVKVDGTALKIYRRSTPFGRVEGHGLYFVAFACERRRIEIPLKRMFGLSDDRIHDRLTSFSRAVSGSYWFAPNEQALASLSFV
jgi:putative iron-dependent peroxidase